MHRPRAPWVLLAVLVLGRPAALAEPAAPVAPEPCRDEPWTGAWLVAGATCARYVWPEPDGTLVLEGALPATGRLALRGPLPAPGAPLVLRGRLARRDVLLTAGPGADALRVRLSVDGAAVAEERWYRPGPPGLAIEDLRPRAGGGLLVEVGVTGRPQAVTLQVLASAGDERYAALGGVVHHERLSGGERLPVGRYRVTWDGLDRSWDPQPVQPGAYRLVLEPRDGLAPHAASEAAERRFEVPGAD